MAEEQLQETHYIYKMRCCVTLMSYVGRTKHPGEQRKAEHRNGSSGKKLRAAIELYGFDSFSFEIIYECHSKAQACKYERLFIALLGTAWPNGYNIMGGGPGSLSRVATEDSKKRRAAAQRRLWDDPNHRTKVSKRVKEFWSRPENRAILSERMRARWADPTEREKLSVSHWSRSHTNETREKIRQLALARAERKRKDGHVSQPLALIEGTKKSWAHSGKRSKRLASIKAFWEGDAGIAMRARLSAEMTAINKLRWADPEYAQRLRESNAKSASQRIISAETRAKMSAAAKRRAHRPAGWKHTEKTRAQMRASALRRIERGRLSNA